MDIAIISKTFQTEKVQIDIDFSLNQTVYLNATKVAYAFNKDLSNWKRSKQTTQYIDVLLSSVDFTELKLTENDLFKVVLGKGKDQGTWIHKSLIILFARWLSPEFAVWCDLQIEEILSGESTKKVNLSKLEERAKLLEISQKEYKIFEDIFYKIGITRPEELAITSNRAVAKETGVDFIELAERKGVSTPDRYFTVTELCQKVIASDKFSEEVKALVSTKAGDKPRPQNLNKLLQTNGLQIKVDGEWKSTENGKKFSDLVRNKSINSEKSVFHLLWKIEVLEELF
jgi:uncharacterized metal-binding protein